MNNTNLSSKATVVTATGNVQSRPGALLGIFVSAASAVPTITIYDNASTGTTNALVTIFTPVAATWYPLPFDVQNGIYIVVGGTVSCTVARQEA